MPHPSLRKNPITRLRDRFHRLFTPSPLLEALKERGMLKTDTPREKARLLVQSLQDVTFACMREQRHILGYGAQDRLVALRRLAESLTEGDWCPKGLKKAELDLIGTGLIEDVVWATANGVSVNTLETKIYELFRLAAEHQNLPEVRPLRNGRESSRLRPRPRRRV